MFDGCSDMTIDDDKLRHSSRGFRSAGLQMSGFRGSRIGPVMNDIASVQTGIVHSIHFNRHGDNPLSITFTLLYHIDYGTNGLFMKNRLDALILLDRAYNYEGVQNFLCKLGVRFLGTHSEKFGNWPFSTNGTEKKTIHK